METEIITENVHEGIINLLNMNKTPHHHFASFFKEQEDLQPFAYAVSRQLAQGSVCLDLKEKPSAAELFEGYQEEPNGS